LQRFNTFPRRILANLHFWVQYTQSVARAVFGKSAATAAAARLLCRHERQSDWRGNGRDSGRQPCDLESGHLECLGLDRTREHLVSPSKVSRCPRFANGPQAASVPSCPSATFCKNVTATDRLERVGPRCGRRLLKLTLTAAAVRTHYCGLEIRERTISCVRDRERSIIVSFPSAIIGRGVDWPSRFDRITGFRVSVVNSLLYFIGQLDVFIYFCFDSDLKLYSCGHYIRIHLLF